MARSYPTLPPCQTEELSTPKCTSREHELEVGVRQGLYHGMRCTVTPSYVAWVWGSRVPAERLPWRVAEHPRLLGPFCLKQDASQQAFAPDCAIVLQIVGTTPNVRQVPDARG